MAYTAVNLPLTGAGDATAAPAVDLIGGLAWQGVKLFDATEGSTVPIIAKAATPDAADPGMVVRFVPTTADAGAVTVKNPTTAVDAAATLTSAGSTRLVGRVDVNNPTTSVSLSSQHTVTIGNPTTAVQANLTSEGSTRLVGQVTVANPTTAVEANLSSLGSSKLVGRVDVNNPTTAVSLSSQHTVTVGNPTTAADANLTSAGSTRSVGTFNQGSPAGTSADAWWVRTVSSGGGGAGSTLVDLGSGGATRSIGIVQGTPFTSDSITRATANSSAEAQLFAANANRDYVMITNMSTAVNLFVGLTSAAVTTLGANAHFVIPPAQTFTLGGQLGNGPKYLGPIRVRLNSTTLVGPVIGVEFST